MPVRAKGFLAFGHKQGGLLGGLGSEGRTSGQHWLAAGGGTAVSEGTVSQGGPHCEGDMGARRSERAQGHKETGEAGAERAGRESRRAEGSQGLARRASGGPLRSLVLTLREMRSHWGCEQRSGTM